MRRWVRSVMLSWLRARATPLSDSELNVPTLVFSPHFDDETLGCGSTILRKCALGAEVHLVFMTDGRASHRDWRSEAEMAQTRSLEGQAAASILGIPANHVHEFGYEETALAAHGDAAVARIVTLLKSIRPAHVFVPHREEPPEDHALTSELVRQAIQKVGSPTTLFEYPVWLWVQWPFTAAPDHPPNPLRRARRQLQSLARFFATFRSRVEAPELTEQKRSALTQHQSQLERPEEFPDWPILSEVEGGDFLPCFFVGFELFAREEFLNSPEVGESSPAGGESRAKAPHGRS